jgi:hypothetical protein
MVKHSHSKYVIFDINQIKINTKIMLKKISKTDFIMLFLALTSLVFSEIMWFRGENEGALFIGLWVPSILGFAIYLKLLKIENK